MGSVMDETFPQRSPGTWPWAGTGRLRDGNSRVAVAPVAALELSLNGDNGPSWARWGLYASFRAPA
jgi:hypothetical protein